MATLKQFYNEFIQRERIVCPLCGSPNIQNDKLDWICNDCNEKWIKENGESIKYREGKNDDIISIASLICIALSNVIIEFMELIELGYNTNEIIAKILAQNIGHAQIHNSIVAEVNNTVAGMVFLFPAKKFTYNDENISMDWKTAFSFFNPLYCVEDTYYIHSFAVYHEFRNKNIGKTLISLAKKRAQENGFHKMIVGTSESNSISHNVYESQDFKVIGSELSMGMDILECRF